MSHSELLTKYRGTQECKYPLKCGFFKCSLFFTVLISYCHHSWLTGQCKKRGTFLNGMFTCETSVLSGWQCCRETWYPTTLSESYRCVPLALSLQGTCPSVVTAAGTGALCGPLPAGSEGLIQHLSHKFPFMLRYTLTCKYNLLRSDR